MVALNYITEDGYKLGAWVSNQRSKYSNGLLNEERIKLLEKFEFVWNPIQLQWYEKFDCAKQYYEKHGKSAIPKTYVTEKGFKLNYWVNDQRKAYKKGKLETNQIQMLREIGIV